MDYIEVLWPKAIGYIGQQLVTFVTEAATPFLHIYVLIYMHILTKTQNISYVLVIWLGFYTTLAFMDSSCILAQSLKR